MERKLSTQFICKQFKKGILYDTTCSGITNANHAVTVIGYGSDGTNKDYWLIKNSWGTTWGMQGYAKMARNRNPNCLITTYAVYPIISGASVSGDSLPLQFNNSPNAFKLDIALFNFLALYGMCFIAMANVY